MIRGLLILSLVASGFVSGCRFAGTPREEIVRQGGEIEVLSGGGSAVKFTGAQVEDFDLLAVKALGSNHPEYRPIRRLDLSGSRISDDGLDTLEELAASLEWLDLSGTAVSDARVEAFRQAHPACEVLGP